MEEDFYSIQHPPPTILLLLRLPIDYLSILLPFRLTTKNRKF